MPESSEKPEKKPKKKEPLEERREELIAKFKEFLHEKYKKDLVKAANEEKPLIVDFQVLEKFSPDMADLLLTEPETIIDVAQEAVKQIELPSAVSAVPAAATKVRFSNLPETENVNIRDLRAKHLQKFLCTEGTVRRASEVRPEIVETVWECTECGEKTYSPRKGSFISKPFQCSSCKSRTFKQTDKKLIDARWITIEEPFESVEGEKPSQLNAILTEDLVSPDGRRMSDPGNRIKINGILREIPKGKSYSAKLDFFLEGNLVEPTEVGWERIEITKEEEEQIKKLAKDPKIYDKLIASLAPSLYGMSEIKESIIMQMFGGVPRILKDKTKFRGNIHLLLIGDPACLVADERVFLGDGTAKKIKDIGSHHMEKISVPVRIKAKQTEKASLFHVYKNQPVIEITTESGKTLKGSLNQPVLVAKNREKTWKRLDDLKIGERVAISPSIPCWKRAFAPTNWKKSKRRFGPGFKGKLPEKWKPELGGFIGYMLGDGFVRVKKGEITAYVNEKEKDIIEPLSGKIRRLFGLDPTVKRVKSPDHTHNGRLIKSKEYLHHIRFRSTDIAENIVFLREKRVPDAIFTSPDSVVQEFLKWLFQADGSVFSRGRGRRSIQLKQKELKLLKDVQILLLRFGIHSRIYGDNLSIRRGYDILKYAKNIGFAGSVKKTELSRLSKEADRIKRVKKKLSERVVKIRRLRGLYTVYDIEVPKSHRFIANGIVVHNSGKSQLLKLAPSIVPRGKYVSGKGTTAAGLCTVYDTIIQLEDGKLMKIGDLVEEELKNGMKEVKPGIFIAKGNDRKIVSFDSHEMKLKPSKITKYWKLKAPKKMVRVTMQTGKEVIVTPDNPIPLIKSGEIVWKKAKDLNRGESVACARVLFSPKQKAVSTLKFIDETSRVLNAGPLIDMLADKIKQKTTIREYARKSGIGEDKLYHFWRSGEHAGAPKMSNLMDICHDMNLNPNSVFPDKLVLSQYNGHRITMPKEITEDMMYLIGLLAGDGSISKTSFGGYDIKFANSEKWMLDAYKRMCERCIGRIPSYEKTRNRVPYMRFASKIFAGVLNTFGVPDGKKAHKLNVTEELSSLPDNLLKNYLQGVLDTDGSITERRTPGSNHAELDSSSENFIRGIQLLLLRFGIVSRIRKKKGTITKIRGKEVISKDKWALEISGNENLRLFKEHLGFKLPRKLEKLDRIIDRIKEEHTNIDLIPEIGNVIKDARRGLGLSARDIHGYKNYTYEDGSRKPSRRMLKEIVLKMKQHGSNEKLTLLEKLANSDIIWETIKEIEIFENKEHDYVYDVTVEGEHSFVANGMVIHNTATVTKDELMGGWVLEAGAIVLANKGLLAIDEFEKMSTEDQVAMHEALEQGSVSIAKASIVATLPAQTSVLAGGNPKFSRFDAYRSIAEQITIPDTLLSRFDLKFMLRDVPNAEQDKKVVEHILKAREGDYAAAEPVIDPNFIRKYIAYTKTNCEPKLTKETGKLLKDFYLKTRKKAEGGNAPIPITLRQFESLMRLAEASAKIQLSDVVRKEDAQRAMRLMKFSLLQLGFDPETGTIDIDKSEGATSFTERSRIRVLLDIINTLSLKKREIALKDLESAARKEGLENVDDLIEKLKREGMLFEPSPGFVQKV